MRQAFKNRHNYRYAVGNNGLIVDIFSLTPDSREKFSPYFCASCKSKMGTRMGEKNVWHFYHVSDKVNCSHETYLHSTAKELFAEKFRDCVSKKEPFILVLPTEIRCIKYKDMINSDSLCSYTKETECDLTQTYSTVAIEKRHNGFIPDILLTSADGKEFLYVEMAVTHRSDDKKIKNGEKIVELRLKSEEDLLGIKSKRIDTFLPNIEAYNFQKEVTETECFLECTKEISIFMVLKNQLCTRSNIKMHELEEVVKRVDLQCYIIDKDPSTGRDQYEHNIFSSSEQGAKIANCNLCEHAKGQGTGLLNCNVRNKRVLQNDALGCANYIINRSHVFPKEHKTKVFFVENTRKTKDDTKVCIAQTDKEVRAQPILPFFEEK